MEFFSQTYVALRGPTGVPQTAADTIGRLVDRLSPSTLLADRRAAVLALKGLTRDHRREIGDRALPGLLQVLENDAEIDADIGKAVLETLVALCETDENQGGHKEDGLRFSDVVLETDKPVQNLLALLAGTNFYARFSSLQLLSVLLQNRRQAVQGYFLKASNGPSSVLSVLEDSRDIIRNEGASLIQALISHSPDIQKILAFEGVFEKLFKIIISEGGMDGGVVVQEALACIDSLLRFNSSNMSYFRETPIPPQFRTLLLFPVNLPPQEPAPQQFALQFWDEQKAKNASLIIGIVGLLLAAKSDNLQETFMFTRCLVEISLASNFPASLKSQALQVLPVKLNFPLSELILTPYIPVPGSNGEEWDRLEPASALDTLVELGLHGEYNGVNGAVRNREQLELRAEATKVFENFVNADEIKVAIVSAMLPPLGQDQSQAPPITPLLHSLILAPDSSLLDTTAITSTHFSTILFAHLLRSSSGAKSAARQIRPPAAQHSEGGGLFVPADNNSSLAPAQPTTEDDDDDDPPQTILQILNENLSLSLLARSRPDKSERESREWDRIIVAYLAFLSQWLWDDPGAVREFLDAGGLGVLVEPINQSSEVDVIVPALCVFLLGVCYEFNREPGEISRATIHPILNRFGVDSLVGTMTRLREDERFRSIGPERIVITYPTPSHLNPGLKAESDQESEVWFDWAFIDFWKSNYYTVQKGFSTHPDQPSPSASQNAETSMLVASLREVISNQAQEIENLRHQLQQASRSTVDEGALNAQISSLKEQLAAVDKEKQEVSKEQEDLLVLLDELSIKRKRDKERLRGAGLEVSEDDEDEDEDEDEEDDDEE
jgi:hypothetical protein